MCPSASFLFFLVPLSRVVTQFFLFLYCKLLWRGLKFVTRKFTGRCELQRICYNNKHGARRTLKIGRSASTFCQEYFSLTIMWHFNKCTKTAYLILFSFKNNKTRIITEVLQEWGKSFEPCTGVLKFSHRCVTLSPPPLVSLCSCRL